MKKLVTIIMGLPKRIVKAILSFNPKTSMISFSKTTARLSSFVFLLLVYLFEVCWKWFLSRRFIPSAVNKALVPPVSRVCNRIYELTKHKGSSLNRVNLIQIALKNMAFKPARTFITIGGMAVGIAAIVFLVSLGYGLQRLVINRVARLDELKQIDVTPQVGSQLDITDETISSFKDIPDVEHVLPLITVVGRVNYQNSVSDVAVFGVTAEYLRQSALKPVQGNIFESDNLSYILPPEDNTGQVAGAQTVAVEKGEVIGKVDVSIEPGAWIRVRSGPDVQSPVLGYTRRMEGVQTGDLVWGGEYVSDTEFGNVAKDKDGVVLGQWIKSSVYLWEKESCEVTNPDCEDGSYSKKRLKDGTQSFQQGYMAVNSMSVTPYKILQKSPSVLGTSVLADEDVASSSASLETTLDGEDKQATTSSFVVVETEDGFVEIASDEEEIEQVTVVELGKEAVREAVVSRAMLQIMGLSDTEAVGKTFAATFVVTGDLLSSETEKIESAESDYKIVGIDPDENTPFFYVPFIDLRSLGVTKYSQIKIVAKNDNSLEQIRAQIESAGYITASVVDTVSQIDSLFSTVRLILGSIGLVALSVAGLGMFNTMSISLLERTREVGLMKAMGMRSNEVHELFLTESMTMGFFGGVFGIILGVAGGKLISLILSVISVANGVGFVDISYLPISFSVFIVVLSIIVGIATGYYPARRATSISALNALRYE